MKNSFDKFNNASTMVLVVDMVNGFCADGALASPLICALVEPIAQFLESVPNAKKVFVCDKHDDNSVEFDVFPPHCHNEKEQAIPQRLAHFAHQIVCKNSTNGIFALKKSLDLTKYNRFVLVGDCTDICILQLGLALKSYLNESNQRAEVGVITSLTATFDAPNHNAQTLSDAAFLLLEVNGVALY